jgi:hypothetical protein
MHVACQRNTFGIHMCKDEGKRRLQGVAARDGGSEHSHMSTNQCAA